jgi:hypothetical protein
MRLVLTGLLLLALGGVSSAQTVPCPSGIPAEIPCKKIRIFNNSAAKLYVIIESGERPVDEWLQAQFNVPPSELNNRHYASSQVIRVYVNGDEGIPANGGSVDVWVPFYSRLVDGTPTGAQPNEFIDWWNGGRIYLYDDTDQIRKNYKNDGEKRLTPKTPGPCVSAVDGNCSNSQLEIFYRPHTDPRGTGLPATDRSQLMEYTFADAITVKKPYTINLSGVGYNISSVDQVYLPVAMEALTQPKGGVPYIGTVMPVGTVNDPATANTFRGRLAKFLRDFPGWPVYNYSNNPIQPPPADRPRIPGAYNTWFAPGDDFSAPGATITAMRNLFIGCKTSTAGICDPYSKVIKLFNQNYQDYLALGSCAPPIPANQLDTEMLKRIYGWVPFQGTCGAKANDLLGTTQTLCKNGDNNFCDFNKFQEQVYTKALQYSKWDGGVSFSFNPYVKLIHDLNYLHMAAYAFSVDDAIGFQSYPGIGIIIAYAGDGGLDNKTPLDRTKRVVVSLGVKHQGIPEWASIGICSDDTSKSVDPLFPSATFYPSGYPCTFTAQDLKGFKYQLVIQTGPPNLAVNIPSSCNPLPQIAPWICFVKVATIDDEKNYINTGTTIPASPPFTFNFPSTHDFNADGKSDILWRHTGGTAAMWMMNGAVLASSITLSPTKDNTWSIVGQRDFDRDGKADVLWRHSGGNLERWFLNGTGTGPAVISTQPFGNVAPNWIVVGTGDFNGDGFGDALWRCTTTQVGVCTSGDAAVWLMNDTTQLVGAAAFGGVPLTWSIVGVGHFNGNTTIPRNSDILWRDATTNAVAIWFMNGISLINSQTIGAKAADWTVVGTGDFDGDGFNDVLWRRSNGEVEIWLIQGAMNSASIKLIHNFGIIPTDWSVALTGDFDFDGKSDILWRKTGSISPGAVGTTSIWFMNGVAIKSTGNAGIVDLSWTVQSAGAE